MINGKAKTSGWKSNIATLKTTGYNTNTNKLVKVNFFDKLLYLAIFDKGNTVEARAKPCNINNNLIEGNILDNHPIG